MYNSHNSGKISTKRISNATAIGNYSHTKESKCRYPKGLAKFYGTDFHLDQLQAQLIALHCSDDERDLQSIASLIPQ